MVSTDLYRQHAKQLLADCAKTYKGDFSPGNDLPNTQEVSHYDTHENQQKYTHMYLGKHIALWSEIHATIPDTHDRPVISIGAGPMLDLFGWCWNSPPGDTQVVAYDALDWQGVRALPAWDALCKSVISNHTYHSGAVFPDPRYAKAVGEHHRHRG